MTITASGVSIPEYTKIETLFNRDPTNKKHVIPWDFRLDEFKMITEWLVTEKIDGTNVRVIYQNREVRFGGRTDAAQMPVALLDVLREIFPAQVFSDVFPIVEASENPEEYNDRSFPTVVLFGEGYGPKIQKGGGGYRDTPGFRLFDVCVWGADNDGDGRWWWLRWADVVDVAQKLGIPTVPVLGKGTLSESIGMIGRKSVTAVEDTGRDHRQEGVVVRTDPPLFTRAGDRLVWKLKARDLPIHPDDLSVMTVFQFFGPRP